MCLRACVVWGWKPSKSASVLCVPVMFGRWIVPLPTDPLSVHAETPAAGKHLLDTVGKHGAVGGGACGNSLPPLQSPPG